MTMSVTVIMAFSLLVALGRDTKLTLFLIKTPFNVFANRADPDQGALVRAA